MKPTLDVSSRVSAELSRFIERVVNDADIEEAPTLSDVCEQVQRRTSGAERHDRIVHPQESTSMLAEIHALVDEYGPEAPAIDFVAANASESLSRIIEHVVERTRPGHRPTLAMLRDAMADGLVAEFVGDGSIEADEEQTLQEEVEGLVEGNGEEALAESFIRFE